MRCHIVSLTPLGFDLRSRVLIRIRKLLRTDAQEIPECGYIAIPADTSLAQLRIDGILIERVFPDAVDSSDLDFTPVYPVVGNRVKIVKGPYRGLSGTLTDESWVTVTLMTRELRVPISLDQVEHVPQDY